VPSNKVGEVPPLKSFKSLFQNNLSNVGGLGYLRAENCELMLGQISGSFRMMPCYLSLLVYEALFKSFFSPVLPLFVTMIITEKT
jgi:hypothetical protein